MKTAPVWAWLAGSATPVLAEILSRDEFSDAGTFQYEANYLATGGQALGLPLTHNDHSIWRLRWSRLSPDALTRENKRLRRQLAQAELIIDVQKSGVLARLVDGAADQRCILMDAVNLLAPEVGLAHACNAMHVPRSSAYCRKLPFSAFAITSK